MRIIALLVATAAAALGADLPVKQVILYKHGVGYFERAGRLKPGEPARLDFKASEMNDVLKSLTITDAGGATITGLRYDSSEPLARKLAEFPFRLGDSQPLSALLDQLKGARLEAKYGSETVSGVIVSGRLAPAEEKRGEREQVVVLTGAGELRTLDLAAATSIRFESPELQALLKDYLTAVNNARSQDKRSVYIDSSGGGARDIIAGYVIPAPVWKSSYRLMFSGAAEPLLEGWAIVDNSTGEDWTNVQLAVVSGRPISFVSRLYEPRFVARPTAELAEERAQAPVVHEGGVTGGVVGGIMAAAQAEEKAGAGDVARRRMAPMELRAAAPAPAVRADVASSVAAAAETRDLGELFEYRFSHPVTVRKSESAMLPFLQQRIAGRKLLIYSDTSSQYPLNAAEISNATGKTLDGGPITVFDGGAYGGEALMETLKAGDKRLISYAVDLGTRITTQFDSGAENIREFHLRRGVLTTRNAVQETRTFTIRNVDQRAKTLIVEHRVRPQYKLVNLKPSETTASAYRFEVKLPPGAVEKLPVVEERVYENTFLVASLTPDVLMSFVRNKALTETARKQLEEIHRLKTQIAAADGESRRTETQINELVQDQERLRQNIASLNRVSGQQEQVQNYARQLATQETQLASLRDRLSASRKQRTALEAELNSLIEKLEF